MTDLEARVREVLRQNIWTLEQTRRRCQEWDKSHHEIDTAIAESCAALGQPAPLCTKPEGQYPDPEAIRQKRIAETLDAAIDFIADEYRTRDYEDQGEWLPPKARAIHANLIALRHGPNPSPLPEPQDVREALHKARRFIIAAKAQAEYPKGVSYPSAIAEALSVALESLNAALAQSDAQPVGWRRRWKDPATGNWGKWNYNHAESPPYEGPHQRNDVEAEPFYTAPPRPDASGLIEAAEAQFPLIYKALDDCQEWVLKLGVTERVACHFIDRLRSRAADRSAPRSDKGGA